MRTKQEVKKIAELVDKLENVDEVISRVNKQILEINTNSLEGLGYTVIKLPKNYQHKVLNAILEIAFNAKSDIEKQLNLKE